MNDPMTEAVEPGVGVQWRVMPREALADLLDTLERAQTLASLVTVRQAIEAGDDAINAAGLNPYCMNEGRASGDESIYFWRLDSVIEEIKQALEAAA